MRNRFIGFLGVALCTCLLLLMPILAVFVALGSSSVKGFIEDMKEGLSLTLEGLKGGLTMLILNVSEDTLS